MNAIDDAKREINDTKTRFLTAARLILASPVVMAVSAVGAVAFGSELSYAPNRLPPIAGLSLASVGLPSLDLGAAGDQLKQASDAAVRQGAVDKVGQFFADHPAAALAANVIGLAACLGLLAWTIWIRTRLYRELPAHAALRAPGPATR